jgi:hypothetical protein
MLLLADRLIEASLTYRGPKHLRDEFAYLARKIEGAQRFVVSPDVRGAIRSLLTSRPSTLVQAAPFARLPFERCWFEWTPPGDANLHPGQVSVSRCGAVLEAYGPHGFTMFTAWEYEPKAHLAAIKEEVRRQVPDDQYDVIDHRLVPNYGVSSVVGAYDLSDFDGPPAMDSDPHFKWFHQRPLTRDDLDRQRDDVKNGVRWALKDEKEWRAIKQLEERSAFRVHHETHGSEKIEAQHRETGDISSIIHDVQDEMGHLFATLILMNSKNCVNVAKAELPVKLNKARRKHGKRELLPYSTVHIELTKSQQRAVASGVMSREEARRHLVRGHFKVRASGVFWWGDFWRGNAARGTIERSTHVIETGENVDG